ncbi:MAG TPA: M20/M25/M40 family metallo-hydrolase, partial [Candidatus Eisenbacteria bacterium]|nr:M20/M25/M40 family metallo-hydrolase [Candidatus Eisenbacteria bacterium]
IGEEAVQTMPAPEMGAEDFSYVLQRVPGAMVFLGGRSPDEDPAKYADNHSDRVVFDEPAMAVGAALYAEVGLRLFTDRG